MLKYHISDYIGKRYGYLVVIGQTSNSKIPNAFDFKCDCGKIVSYPPDRVIKGRQKSCGKCKFSNRQPQKINMEQYIGKRSNMLTAIGLSERRPTDKRQYIDCLCDCGNTIRILPYQFRSRKIKSCGCLLKNSPAYIDGRTLNPLYGLWKNMLGRCENENHPKYYQYGKRGISVCEEWHDFWSFVEWSDSIGGRPDGYSIDRIDNDGNYEPSNCRWATSEEQSINRSSNLNIQYKGQTKTLKEWSVILDISWDVLHNRLRKGWSVERAFSEKPKK